VSATEQQTVMTDEEFLLIRDLVFDHCGIFMPDSVKYVVERRLRPRLDVYEAATFREYYRSVKYGRDKAHELDEIVDLITTNETYFFREPHQLTCFTQEIIPKLMHGREAGNPIRIWSAGCSSGEEPYTIAMLLQDMQLPPAVTFEVFGSDISRKVLRAARQAVYRQASFRETSATHLDRYFTKQGSEYLLRADIRNRVTFSHLNLMDEAALALVANVDVIFCRNVMIYFSKDSRTRVLGSFYSKMRSGGYLLLGHSESLVNASTNFEIVALKNDIVYRKPLPVQVKRP
jgi:chemotaxis protein methyltransferase CheR